MRRIKQPQRGCGSGMKARHNPVGVETDATRKPRVARSSQPWAGGHNPFGIAERVRSRRFAGTLQSVVLRGRLTLRAEENGFLFGAFDFDAVGFDAGIVLEGLMDDAAVE